MKLSQQYNHDPRHYQFQRCTYESPVFERWEPRSPVRWGIYAAAAVIGLLALAFA
jgi:hypothetical protein